MRKIIKKILPTRALDYYSKLKYSARASKFKDSSTSDTFTQIYSTNHWGNSETVSGIGSTVQNAKNLIDAFDGILKKYAIESVFDIPCGDFNWMQHIKLSDIQYTGADIVEALVVGNTERHADETTKFEILDLIKDDLPQNDLVMVRDCFVHFSYDDIRKSIANLKRSKSTYLFTTSFTKHQLNHDIVTGDWRPINLCKSPFNFPTPLLVIDEFCAPEYQSEFKGKSMALWQISDL